MRIYAASIVFWQRTNTNDFPITATSGAYSTLSAFMDFAELTVRQRKEFPSSNVTVNAIECQVLSNGQVLPMNTDVRVFRNLTQQTKNV